MSRFVPGQEVMIPCSVARSGPPGEVVVDMESAHGLVSGFVNAKAVTGDGDRGLIRGWIVEVSGESVVVQVPGEFLTTASGKAELRADWADTHLQPIRV